MGEFAIKVPEWCAIGAMVEWSAPHITGEEWVIETIHSYGTDGFFHKAHNCPLYYTKFQEFGKSVRLPRKREQAKTAAEEEKHTKFEELLSKCKTLPSSEFLKGPIEEMLELCATNAEEDAVELEEEIW